MSTGSQDEPPVPKDVDTPAREERQDQAGVIPHPHVPEDEGGDEMFEDASDDGEVLIRRDVPRMNVFPPAPRHAVSTSPQFKPEDFDGTTDWSEYQIYFEQLAELNGWEDEKRAMILGVCLRGEARVVLASLNAAQRRSYRSLGL